MANGFFLGGVAEGANQARQTGIQQQQVDQQGSFQQKSLAIQEQAQKNQQQRELYARADKDVSNLMGVADETIKNLKLAGKDNATIAKAIQPIVQQAKRLKQSAGGDPSAIDAQVAATLAMPGVNPASFGGGSAGAPASSAPAPASSADTGGGTPMPPGQNLTGPNTTVTGVDYGAVETRNTKGQPIASPAQPQSQPAAPNPQAEVDHWTRTLATLPSYATPSMKEAAKMRLTQAMTAAQPDASVHFMKTEDGNEVPLVIKKQGGTVSVTDTKGNPYVVPTGDQETDAKVIADAVRSGKQPPVLTGLYKNSKAVRAALARSGFDLTTAQLEWKGAEKQVQSLNGPQMVRYAGLAGSVVNTIDEVRSLATELKNSGIPALNAAKLQTLIQTAGNTPSGQLATRYQAAVNTLKEEFANLANGGYAPTEPAWALANQQINGNYGLDQLNAGLTEVQRLIRYRLNAIPNFKTVGAGGQNRYINGGAAPDAGHGGAASPAASSPPPPPPGFVVTSPR